MKYLHLIWAALFRSKTRTFLTLLSVVTPGSGWAPAVSELVQLATQVAVAVTGKPSAYPTEDRENGKAQAPAGASPPVYGVVNCS